MPPSSLPPSARASPDLDPCHPDAKTPGAAEEARWNAAAAAAAAGATGGGTTVVVSEGAGEGETQEDDATGEVVEFGQSRFIK